MTETAGAELVPANGCELDVVVEPEGLLVAGDPDIVEGYLQRLRGIAGDAFTVSGIGKTNALNAGAGAAGMLSNVLTRGQFVQLSPESMKALRLHRVVPGSNGYNRMMVTDKAGLFKQQLQWKSVSLTPTAALSVQLIAVQVALMSALAEVSESIARVEDKVDQMLTMLAANRVGDVVGRNAMVRRVSESYEKTSVFPETDWDSIASLGPDLVVDVERLRAHVRRTLEGFDESKAVQIRADYLHRAVGDNRLGESLHLLVIAQDSLYRWQRLRIARVSLVEPAHLAHVVSDARDLMAEQLRNDVALVTQAGGVLASYAKMNRLDGFRWQSTANLKNDSEQLQRDLDAFAAARRHQIAEWSEYARPTVGDALSEVGDRAVHLGSIAGRGVGAAALTVGRFGRGIGAFARASREAEPVEVRRDTEQSAS